MPKFRNIKRADGRTQRAMVLASGKLKFVKNKSGGHAPSRKKTKHMAKKKRSTAMTHKRRSSHHMTKRSRRRGRSHGGGMSLVKLGGATLAMSYLLGPKSPMPTMKTYADKIPGAKTWGAPAAVGIAALAIDRFAKPNRWLKLLGAAGIVLAAANIGSAGTDFKFVGDADDVADMDDIGDEDDVGDEDD